MSETYKKRLCVLPGAWNDPDRKGFCVGPKCEAWRDKHATEHIQTFMANPHYITRWFVEGHWAHGDLPIKVRGKWVKTDETRDEQRTKVNGWFRADTTYTETMRKFIFVLDEVGYCGLAGQSDDA
jgi:hypothetical protein